MKKINELIRKAISLLLNDKTYHFMVAFFVFNCLTLLFGTFWLPFILTTIVIFVKEVYDLNKVGKEITFKNLDWWDILAGMVGIVFAMFVLYCNMKRVETTHFDQLLISIENEIKTLMK